MRTESSTSTASAASRLRDGLARARRWVRGRRAVFRVTLIVAVAVALAAIAYMSIPLERDEIVLLYEGRKFSQSRGRAIEKALLEEKIPCKRSGRSVGVYRSNWSDAMSALVKHGVQVESIEDLEKEPLPVSWTDTQADRLERERWRLERWLKASIEEFDPSIRSASVSIQRTQIHAREWKFSGLVMLDTERSPSHKLIRSIQTLLTKRVPGLLPDAVTIGDSSGTFFLEAGNPTLESATLSHAREEDLRDLLIENLAKIVPGVDVVVQVETEAEMQPTPAPSVQPAKVNPPLPAPPAEEVKANRPVSLADPEPVPVTNPEPIPPPTPPQTIPTLAAPAVARANIWVKVPRSHYLRIFHENAPNRQPSAEDMTPLHLKTKGLIENAVSVLVPSSERGRVLIDSIPDDLGTNSPVVVPSGATEAARSWPDWVAPAALGVGAGLVMALVLGTAGAGLIAARRPASRPSRTSVRSGLAVDIPAPSGPVPGPSERVRDLVRRDPEAAAGVLQRWIGSGEGGPIA
jgi:flagellar biosynthesis/type III secretory pathway M-ring protein FliF/YscJ